MALPIPSANTFCIQLQTGPGELCVVLPGGAAICAQIGLETGSASAITRGLLASANTGLAPLQPFFDMLDVLKAIVDCIEAIPDTIGPPPDPTAILQCIPGLVQKLNKLLALLPPFSIPATVVSIIDVMIVALLGLRAELQALIAQQVRLLAAATRAAQTGNLELQLVVDCAIDNMDAQLVNLNSSMSPLTRLLGVLNTLLKLANLPCIPGLGGLSSIDDAALAVIDAAIQALQIAKALVPSASFELPVAPGPDDPC